MLPQNDKIMIRLLWLLFWEYEMSILFSHSFDNNTIIWNTCWNVLQHKTDLQEKKINIFFKYNYRKMIYNFIFLCLKISIDTHLFLSYEKIFRTLFWKIVLVWIWFIRVKSQPETDLSPKQLVDRNWCKTQSWTSSFLSC